MVARFSRTDSVRMHHEASAIPRGVGKSTAKVVTHTRGRQIIDSPNVAQTRSKTVVGVGGYRYMMPRIVRARESPGSIRIVSEGLWRPGSSAKATSVLMIRSEE